MYEQLWKMEYVLSVMQLLVLFDIEASQSFGYLCFFFFEDG